MKANIATPFILRHLIAPGSKSATDHIDRRSRPGNLREFSRFKRNHITGHGECRKKAERVSMLATIPCIQRVLKLLRFVLS
jgi:hypothetical protein